MIVKSTDNILHFLIDSSLVPSHQKTKRHLILSYCEGERETAQNVRGTFALRRPERSGDLEPFKPGRA